MTADPKSQITVYDRQQADKQKVLENLKKMPIIELACKAAKVGRSTFYRWKSEDKEFAKSASAAMEEGILLMNDMTEAQLLNMARMNNMRAITFWLQHRHKAYANKLKVEADIKNLTNQELTKEQKDLIEQAVRLAGLTDPETNSQKDDNTNNLNGTGSK